MKKLDEQLKIKKLEEQLNNQFIFDGIVIVLLISVINNIQTLNFLDFANEFVTLLVIWYGIVEHFIKKSYIINLGLNFRVLFYLLFVGGSTISTVAYKIYGLPYVPILLPVILATLLIGHEFGISIGLLLSFSVSFHLNDFYMFVFLLPQLFVATYTLKNSKSRLQVAKSGILAGLVAGMMMFFQSPVRHYYFSVRDYSIMILNPLVSSIFALGILPYIEASTRIYSNIGLSEIDNISHPILNQFSIYATGSYLHSSIVAHLSESAAQAIGANAILARTGAYFHDIGKIRNPKYFTENIAPGEENPHNSLPPEASFRIIQQHVKDGLEIARKYRLPVQIELFIEQHHGKRLQIYFYDKARKINENVSPDNFRYNFRKPQLKEIGIVMLADSVEATFRSKRNLPVEKIPELVSETVLKIYNERQLDETELTIAELEKITEAFTKVLVNLSANRVEYPKVDEINVNEVRL